MALPRVVSREEWLTARTDFLVEEKEFTRARDALSAARRALPMVAVDKEYDFDGPPGTLRLLDLFDGRHQLVVYHFMFDPGWDEGCPMCSFLVDNMPNLTHLREARDTAVVVVSRAPLDKITAFKQRMGWTLPWYSSYGSDFNYDFHVTLDEAVAPVEYNYREKATTENLGQTWDLRGEQPAVSVFLRDGEHVFHTYSTYQRGPDLLLGTYNYLDLTPLGRQEDGPGPHEFRHHDRYPTAPRGAK
jgi:predicted dithiol-disulfide oxidoreductase (DUF899 family)